MRIGAMNIGGERYEPQADVAPRQFMNAYSSGANKRPETPAILRQETATGPFAGAQDNPASRTLQEGAAAYEARTGRTRTWQDFGNAINQRALSYGLRPESFKDAAGVDRQRISPGYWQRVASTNSFSVADRRNAQNILNQYNRDEQQQRQITGGIAIAGKQAEAAEGIKSAEWAARQAINERKVQGQESVAGIKAESDQTIAQRKIDTLLAIKKLGIAQANDDRRDKMSAAELAAQTDITVAELKVKGDLEGAEILAKSKSTGKIDPVTFMMATPEERKVLISRAGITPAVAAPAPVTPIATTPAGTQGGENLPIYTPEQAKNLKPGIRFKGTDGTIRTT
jgi:hypothetical protein